MDITAKQVGIGAAIVAGAGLLIYWLWPETFKPKTPPSDTQPGGGSLVGQIAAALHADMAGLNFGIWQDHDLEPYQQALALSNTQFVELYNVFGDNYFSEGGTLTQWLEDEIDMGADDAWIALKESMIQRLGSLNLT